MSRAPGCARTQLPAPSIASTRLPSPGAGPLTCWSMFKTPGPFTDDGPGARARAVPRALLAFVVFPNLLFLALGLFFFTTRSLINLDYIGLGATWLFLPPWARIALFAAAFILDAVGSTAAMYNIHVFTGIVALLDAPVGLIITVILGLLVSLGLAF